MRRVACLACPVLIVVTLGCGGFGTTECAVDGNASARPEGPYLGQDPPGPEPVLFAPGIVSTGGQELNIVFAPGGDEAFFCATGPAFRPRFIFHTRMEEGLWTAPREAPFTDPGRTDSYPSMTPDGNRVFFCSSRPSGGADTYGRHHEIWYADREESGWAEPQKIDFGGELGGFGTSPSVAASGNLYFNGGSNATNSDIFVSKFVDGRYTTPENLGPGVNSDAGDFHPYIAPDETFLLFDSQREQGSFGGNDIYISRRAEDGSWSDAENLGPAVNTASGDLRPFVTGDGKYLFFASTRVSEDFMPDGPLDFETVVQRLQQPGNGFQDIYWVSAEVLRQ